MQYIFRGGDEFIKLKIDRVAQSCEVATSRTNYRFIPQPFWKLFGDKPNDQEGALKEMAECQSLSNLEFEQRIIHALLRIGYTLVKKDD